MRILDQKKVRIRGFRMRMRIRIANPVINFLKLLILHGLQFTNDRFRERELRNDNHFRIPHLRYRYLSNHPFVYYPQIWNALPDNIKKQNRKTKFCKDLKKYLFDQD